MNLLNIELLQSCGQSRDTVCLRFQSDELIAGAQVFKLHIVDFKEMEH